LNLPNVDGDVAAPWAADLKSREFAKLLLFAKLQHQAASGYAQIFCR
jgi:hypothetical protein